MERIVVFRPGALGDTLLAVDALAGLRRQFPDAWLEFVGHGEGGALLKSTGLVDEATDFDAPAVTGLFRDPPRIPPQWEGADLVVLWLREMDGLIQAFKGAGARMVIAAAPEPIEDIHVADHLLLSLAPAGCQLLAEPATLRSEAPVVPKDLSGPALVHPGSGSARKNWATDSLTVLCRRLALGGLAVELLEGPADGEAVAHVAMALGPSIKINRSADVFELARMLALARLVVGNDSGVSHLSARLGMPTVAVFGATDPSRWAPRGPGVEVVGGMGTWPSAEAVWAACQRAIADPPRYPEIRSLAERWSRKGYFSRDR